MLGRRHFGKRDDEVLGKPPAVGDEPRHEEVESADRARLHLVGEGLDADADRMRKRAGGEPRRDFHRRRKGVAILLGVGSDAVAVLEVDPVILDGLPLELLQDARIDDRRKPFREPDRAAEFGRGGRKVLQRALGQGPHLRRRVGLEDLSSSVDRVDRLAAEGLARVTPGELGIDFLQPRAQGVEKLRREGGRGGHAVSLQNCSSRFAATWRR